MSKRIGQWIMYCVMSCTLATASAVAQDGADDDLSFVMPATPEAVEQLRQEALAEAALEVNREDTEARYRTAALAGVRAALADEPASEFNLAPVGPEVIERGRQVAAICITCHMADGSGSIIPRVEFRPRLTGLTPEYLMNQLMSFKKGTRHHYSMTPFAQYISEEDIYAVSHYYASLPVVLGSYELVNEEVSPEVLAHGEKLVNRGDWQRYVPACISCHGSVTQGIGERFPGLVGQHADYISKTLKDWRSGNRAGDPLQLMTKVAQRLSDEDIEAVAAYLASQQAVANKH